MQIVAYYHPLNKQTMLPTGVGLLKEANVFNVQYVFVWECAYVIQKF